MKRIGKDLRYGFYLGILLAVATHAAETPMELKPDDLPRLVQENNGNAKASTLRKQAAEHRDGFLFRSYLPRLEASASGEYFRTGTYSARSQPLGTLEARVNLFRGGRDSAVSSARRAAYEESREDERRAVSHELRDAREFYWTLVVQSELLKIYVDALEQTKTLGRSVAKRIKRGLTTATDSQQFELAELEIEEEIHFLKSHSEFTKRSLLATLGMDDRDLTTIPVISHRHAPETYEKLVQDLEPAAPQIMILTAKAEQLKNKSLEVGRWWVPSIDLYAGTDLYTLREREYLSASDRIDTYVGAQLKFTLGDLWEDIQGSSATYAEALALQSQEQQKRRQIKADLSNLRDELEHKNHLVIDARSRIEKGKKLFSQVIDEYHRGVRSSLEVLSIFHQYVQLKRHEAEHRKEYKLVEAELFELLGK